MYFNVPERCIFGFIEVSYMTEKKDNWYLFSTKIIMFSCRNTFSVVWKVTLYNHTTLYINNHRDFGQNIQFILSNGTLYQSRIKNRKFRVFIVTIENNSQCIFQTIHMEI